ncbi:ABC transporter permease [Actinoplanes sp. NPDC049599]|uniref:ABC transporter permease n=1 Tax=Actinoplanes sp. NPDC049599 TaxID=3363903 RepID=UPI003790A6DF
MSSSVLDRTGVAAGPVGTHQPDDDVAPEPRWRRVTRRLTPVRKVSGLLAVLVLWQVGAGAGWLGGTTPSPTEVIAAGRELIAGGELAHHLGVSLARVAKGLAIGLTAGLLLGLAAGLLRLAEDLVDAPIQSLRMLPHLALVPIFIIWFGIGETSKIALIAIGPIFPLYLNVLHGIRGVDERLVESARSCGVGRLGLIFRVILPGALPQILVGLRQALGLGWLSLVVAEQTATTAGVGFLMNDAREFLRTDVIFVVLVIYALLGLGTDLFVRLIERRALAWRRGFTGE